MLARHHAIERTSPKGEDFIGTCWQCGQSGLTMADALRYCENTAQLTCEESFVMALDGPESQEKEDDTQQTTDTQGS